MFGLWLGRPRVPSGAWPHVPGVCQLLDDKDTDAIKWLPIPPESNRALPVSATMTHHR